MSSEEQYSTRFSLPAEELSSNSTAETKRLFRLLTKCVEANDVDNLRIVLSENSPSPPLLAHALWNCTKSSDRCVLYIHYSFYI